VSLHNCYKCVYLASSALNKDDSNPAKKNERGQQICEVEGNRIR
jgi:hypothetical protein